MGLPRGRVTEALELVGLTADEARRRVRDYSLGMRQRLGLAHAHHHRRDAGQPRESGTRPTRTMAHPHVNSPRPRPARNGHARLPLARLVGVELRKMVDTPLHAGAPLRPSPDGQGRGDGSRDVAVAVGAVGNSAGAGLSGTAATWDFTAEDAACFALAQTLFLLVGCTFGTLVRSSAGAVVAFMI
jgi:hypothetical protein